MSNTFSHEGAARTGAGSAGRRVLFIIPIIHDRVDMGAMGEVIERMTLSSLGSGGVERNLAMIERLWDEIQREVERLELCWERVRIYQDGLPVCDQAVQIVCELAQAGSRNHRLLLSMRGRGAAIMGTESPELLVREYQLCLERLKRGDLSGSTDSGDAELAIGRSILQGRDRAIAERVNSTLQQGETGLLFLGMLHNVQPWLERDVEVRRLFPNLPLSPDRADREDHEGDPAGAGAPSAHGPAEWD